jgi:hypothetical protein
MVDPGAGLPFMITSIEERGNRQDESHASRLLGELNGAA